MSPSVNDTPIYLVKETQLAVSFYLVHSAPQKLYVEGTYVHHLAQSSCRAEGAKLNFHVKGFGTVQISTCKEQAFKPQISFEAYPSIFKV